MSFKISTGEGVSYFQVGSNPVRISDVELYTDRNGKEAFKIEVENAEGKTTFCKCECPNYQGSLERVVSSVQNFVAEINRPLQGVEETKKAFDVRVLAYTEAMLKTEEALVEIAKNYKENYAADYYEDNSDKENWKDRLENLYPCFKDCLDLFFSGDFSLMNAVGKEGFGIFEYSSYGDKRYINPHEFGRFAFENDDKTFTYPSFFSFAERNIERYSKTKSPIRLINPIAPKPKAGENGIPKKEGDPGW